MKTEIVLSLVLPTFNRLNYLKQTLIHFAEQVERNKHHIEFIICNNASTDGTDYFLENDLDSKIYKIFNYKNYVEVGNSIKRSIGNASGKYILLWGDDDIPSPFLIDIIVNFIENTSEKVGIYHFNRLYGYDSTKQSISKLTTQKSTYDQQITVYNRINNFIDNHYLDTSFLSSIVFLNKAWKNASEIDTSSHYGYEFLAPIYLGVKELPCVYINYPLCIQRKPLNRSWMKNAPLYRFIGIPNLLKDLSKYGLIDDFYKTWNEEANTNLEFIKVIAQTCYNRKYYKSIRNEINKNQPGFFRKLLVFIVIYFLPKKLYEIIRSSKK